LIAAHFYSGDIAMLRLLSLLMFAVVLLPIGWARRVFNSSRFSQRFHQGSTAWDHPENTR